MKILYSIHQFFPYYYTGTETLTLNIASYIKKFGNLPFVVSYVPNNLKTEIVVKTINDIDTYHIGLELEKNSRDMELENRETKNKLEEIISIVNPDIIHITHLSRMAEIVQIAKKRNIPYLITLTDFWTICPKTTLLMPNGVNCNGPNQGKKCKKTCFAKYNFEFEKRIKKIEKIFEDAKYITYSSDNLIKIISKNIKIPKEKTIKITHGYNADKMQNKAKKNTFIFAYIGSINIHKGPHIAIKAFKKIKNNKIKLYIYGNLSDNQSYAKYLLTLSKKDKRIIFKGIYKKEETSQVFSEVDAIILPSIWRETYPFVATTSLSYGIPVIGSNIGGIPEIVKNEDMLFQPGNSDDLKEKMLKLLNNNHYNKIKKECFYDQRIENEGFEYEKIYESILKK